MERRKQCSNSAREGEAEVEKIRKGLKLIWQNELWTNWKQQSSIIWTERTSGLLPGQEFGRWRLEIPPLRRKHLERCWEKKSKDWNREGLRQKPKLFQCFKGWKKVLWFSAFTKNPLSFFFLFFQKRSSVGGVSRQYCSTKYVPCY